MQFRNQQVKGQVQEFVKVKYEFVTSTHNQQHVVLDHVVR